MSERVAVRWGRALLLGLSVRAVVRGRRLRGDGLVVVGQRLVVVLVRLVVVDDRRLVETRRLAACVRTLLGRFGVLDRLRIRCVATDGAECVGLLLGDL